MAVWATKLSGAPSDVVSLAPVSRIKAVRLRFTLTISKGQAETQASTDDNQYFIKPQDGGLLCWNVRKQANRNIHWLYGSDEY